MLKGFRDFVLRGNVIELAVAVIIGAAFTAIVTSIAENVINPLIKAIGGSPDTSSLQWQLKAGVDGTTIDLGSVITAAIQFLIIAAILYFVLIAPMNKLNAMRDKGKVEDVPPSEAELLTEIRDLLRAQQSQNTPER